MIDINNIILYSTGCPKCNVLKKKLAEKNVEYAEITHVDKMLALGITQVPVLSINGILMSFKEAVEWINQQGGCVSEYSNKNE